MSQSLTFLSVPPGHHGSISSSQSSISQVSTISILDRFPSLHLREKFEGFKGRLSRISPDPSDNDKRTLQEYEPELIDLIENHVPHRDLVHDGTSFTLKISGDKKVVVIGCKVKKTQEMIEKVLKDSGVEDAIKQRTGFDSVKVNDKFKGHLAKTDSSPAPESEKKDFEDFASLGSQLHISGRKTGVPIATMGGVVLIDGKPYGLTTGYIFRKEAFEAEDYMNIQYTSQNTVSGRIAAYKYSGLKPSKKERSPESQQTNTTTPESSPAKTFESFQTSLFLSSADWALVEIPGSQIPPNTLLGLKWESSEKWLWPQDSENDKLLVEQVVSEENLAKLMKEERGRVACLTYASSKKFIPGFITAGTSSIILDGAVFSVLRVDMEHPLDYGDSGSWVMVGKSVCGVIIAGGTDDDEEQSIFSAYMIPIMDIFNSISQVLSAKVSLPTIVDYRISFLQDKRRAAKWTRDEITPRYLDMELLLGQQKEQGRGHEWVENLKLGSEPNQAMVASLLPQRLGWYSRSILGALANLHDETISQLLSLGEICPLSAAFRPGLRQWAKDYRKFRFENHRAFVCATIMEKCLQTEAGENLLGLLIFLWKTQRVPPLGERENPRNYQSRRIAWLVELLHSLFAIVGVPKVSTPSTKQLQSFVKCIICAFKDKDLKHLYLSLGANYQGIVEPSDEIWSFKPPSRLFTQVVHFLSGWAPWILDQADLLDVDSVLEELPGSLSAWNHTVSATSRILVLLYKIYMGDRTQILVYCGQDAAWVGFYAAMVLGLKVDLRVRTPDGSRALSSEMTSLAQVDVVVYFNPQSWEEWVCEILDRKTANFPDPWGRTMASSLDSRLRTTSPWTWGAVRPRKKRQSRRSRLRKKPMEEPEIELMAYD